jgi:hypothetical protein
VQPAQIAIESAIGISFVVVNNFAASFFMAFFLLVEVIVALGRSSPDKPDEERDQRGENGKDRGGHRIYDLRIQFGSVNRWYGPSLVVG